ncbi:MAG: regulatory protein RecX [Candidatus Omnitrophica bacterium]|nr:regulatory protein RecX [Candidatus Omnitrophota bacterium]
MTLTVKNNPQLKQGYIYALRLLASSKKSEVELLERLARKGYLPDVARQVTQELKARGILSDQKMIEEAIQWSSQSKRYGRRRIFMELKKRGIKSDAIEKALNDYPRNLEREVATQLARDRWARLQKVDFNKRRKRLYDFLINRGFDFDLCRELVAELATKTDENR